MKIGCHVEGEDDLAFIEGIVKKYCPEAKIERADFRGSSGTSLRRELNKALHQLSKQHCDYYVVLVDADKQKWRTVQNNERKKVPEEFNYMTIFGVAERNMECWLAIDRNNLAKELGCLPNEIPKDDPSGFIKSKFRITESGFVDKNTSERIRDFVATADFHTWIKGSDSFKDFWTQIFDKGKEHGGCIPNEQQNPD